jgi:hypothetical protein
VVFESLTYGAIVAPPFAATVISQTDAVEIVGVAPLLRIVELSINL